jgi:DNA uptake protein ComE-like DNA-binding protein
MIRKKHVLWVLAFGLVVPFVAFAQQTPQSSTPPATPPAAHEKHMAKAHSAPRININTGTKEELMTLPGVTEDTADKIIAGRPFKSKSELVSKSIVTKDQFKKLSSMVMTGHMAKAAKASTKK